MNELQLSSPRLTLRLIKRSDLFSIHELHTVPEVDEFNTMGIPQNRAETESIVHAWIGAHQLEEIRQYTLAIIEKASGDFIGIMGFNLVKAKYQRAEIWYKFYPRVWGQGLATEAVKTMLNFGFDELQLHRIEAGCAVGNVGFIRVLEKVGMTREGHCRQALPLKSGWSDNFEYAILASDKRPPIGS